MHGSSQEGMVLSGVWSLVLHVLIRINHWVVGWANNVFDGACTMSRYAASAATPYLLGFIHLDLNE